MSANPIDNLSNLDEAKAARRDQRDSNRDVQANLTSDEYTKVKAIAFSCGYDSVEKFAAVAIMEKAEDLHDRVQKQFGPKRKAK